MNDNGYPNSNQATVLLTVNVVRDNNYPIFTENAQYYVTINEDEPKANRLLNVTATRRGLIVSIGKHAFNYKNIVENQSMLSQDVFKSHNMVKFSS